MIDLNQCPCAGINLDKLLQPSILLSLADEQLHGYGLIGRITDSPMLKGEKPDPTGVYRVLKTMEERGLVSSRWDLVESGKPKRIYKITDQGIDCLARWISSLNDYRASIDELLSHAEGALSKIRSKGRPMDPDQVGTCN
jgi:PadR family transcriptional regulator PadR